MGVGEKLSRPGSPEGEIQVPVPDILEPGTPEKSRPGKQSNEKLTVVQMRRGNRDNIEIIFLIAL